ncbi:hypothetical protein QVD17_26148 [Tagetes erecta]|uniref:Uncharacterized protein n=1 Tax=Tagetes erecta TaxID=13708 RepID=A0AAD8K9L5_TARER|nr:hypothetical protein QVD17_26148 [Tagetes erecta]
MSYCHTFCFSYERNFILFYLLPWCIIKLGVTLKNQTSTSVKIVHCNCKQAIVIHFIFTSIKRSNHQASMSCKRGGGKCNKGKNIVESWSLDVDQLNQAVQDMNMGYNYDDKTKNRSRNRASSKQLSSQNQNPNPRQRTRGGRGNAQVRATLNAVPPPLQNGWNWNYRPGRWADMAVSQPFDVVEDADVDVVVDVEYHIDNDELYESDDELHFDDYDTDDNPPSHEVRKTNRWYADFFVSLDSLTLDQINEPTRRWHCPACQNGPGAINWFCSLQSLLTHAKTKGTKRVKIHRDLAEILEEELRRKGASFNPAGKLYGQWKGLSEVFKDREIVWPPMVIIMNTRLERDENEKWVGMGNPELLDYFGSYEAVKARHSYGPKGHMGMSVLIFESSAVGYKEAKRLSKHFENEGTDRTAWDRNHILFSPGGKRKLYGYMATKGDMDMFNKHAKGKSKLRFELVSYLEKVVDQWKQMSEENQQLQWYKTKDVKHKMHAKALEESIGLVSEKLRKKEIEDRIKKERTQQHCEQLKEELDSQEQFFKDQLKLMQDARDTKEREFDKLQQENRIRIELSSSAADPQWDERLEEMKEYEEEKEMLKSMYMKKKMELEKWFDAEMSRLMDRYTHKN